jgi:hypothetical protein
LRELGYSLQANRKTREGSHHPDRNAQFEYIAAEVAAFQARALPVISVDTKKKELIGEFKNTGREWCRQGHPTRVRVHDFADKKLGKAIPYGIYDLTANLGWVSVGIDHDTAAFAVATIRRWWQNLGQPLYPYARELLITADGGGSNGSRSRLWKVSLQQLADELGVIIRVCHFPPGTSKWNKLEHRLFSQISTNWRGQPLTSHAVIIALIAHTTTATGLRVHAELDSGCYPIGLRITQKQFASVNLFPANFMAIGTTLSGHLWRSSEVEVVTLVYGQLLSADPHHPSDCFGLAINLTLSAFCKSAIRARVKYNNVCLTTLDEGGMVYDRCGVS